MIYTFAAELLFFLGAVALLGYNRLYARALRKIKKGGGTETPRYIVQLGALSTGLSLTAALMILGFLLGILAYHG